MKAVLFALVLLQLALCVFGKTTWRYNYCSNSCANGSQGPTYDCGKSSGYKYYVTGKDAIIDRKWQTSRGMNMKFINCCHASKKKACTFLHADGVNWAQVWEVTKTGAEIGAGIIGSKP